MIVSVCSRNYDIVSAYYSGLGRRKCVFAVLDNVADVKVVVSVNCTRNSEVVRNDRNYRVFAVVNVNVVCGNGNERRSDNAVFIEEEYVFFRIVIADVVVVVNGNGYLDSVFAYVLFDIAFCNVINNIFR